MIIPITVPNRPSIGAILPINRIRYIGNADEFLRAYEVFIHDGNPEQLRNGLPVAYTNLVRRNLEQDEPVIEVDFPLQFVRFIRLVSRSTQGFIMEDIEVFGDGFAPTGEYISEVVDLGRPANFGNIELDSSEDEETRVLLQTRTGTVPDPFIYFRKTEVFEGEGQSEEPILPVGSPEAAAEYDDLRSNEKGSVVDNVLRPILVGRDTKMPDWLILVSTLGGLTTFGISGFVIGPIIAGMFLSVWQMFGEAQEEAAAA